MNKLRLVFLIGALTFLVACQPSDKSAEKTCKTENNVCVHQNLPSHFLYTQHQEKIPENLIATPEVISEYFVDENNTEIYQTTSTLRCKKNDKSPEIIRFFEAVPPSEASTGWYFHRSAVVCENKYFIEEYDGRGYIFYGPWDI